MVPLRLDTAVGAHIADLRRLSFRDETRDTGLFPVDYSGLPMNDAPGEVTLLLRRWRGGDKAALDQLMPVVYNELRRLAGSFFRHETPGHTLQTTALVNEAYLRLVDQHECQWHDRTHFFRIAAKMMRRVLVDHARKKQAERRGGGQAELALDDALGTEQEAGLQLADLVAVHEALSALEKLDSRQSQIVELRVYAGMKNDEVAEALGISVGTVKREWSTAKLWLRRQLAQSG